MFIQMYNEHYMRFPEGKEKALTFSYDDGVTADKKLVAIFNKYGLKGTFNLNSKLFDAREWHGRMDEEETFLTFADSGQEVALHGARHLFLTKVPLASAVKEICDNRAYMESKYGRIVDGMAYAYSDFNDDIVAVLKSLGVKYARTTKPTYSFDIPKDWLRLNPTCHHGDGRLASLTDKFLNESPSMQTKAREPWLFYIWGHAYEYDDDGNWNVIETLAQKVSGRKDVWFATGGEIYNYVQCYNSLVYSLDGERVFNPSCADVWLEIRGKTYKIPAGKTVTPD